MALTLETTSRTGLGQLKIYFTNGNKTTLTAWCSRYEIKHVKEDLKRSNGFKCKVIKTLWNGQEIKAVCMN